MPFLIYSLQRIGSVIAAGALLYLLGLRGFLLLLVAILVGAMLSYIAFDGTRSQSAQALQGWVQRRGEGANARTDAINDEEDQAIDLAQHGAAVGGNASEGADSPVMESPGDEQNQREANPKPQL